MADNEQNIQLTAKLVDQVSSRLKDIQKAMLATEVAGKKMMAGSAAGASAYQKQITAVEKALHQLHEKQTKQQEEHKKRIEAVGEAIKKIISGGVLDGATAFAGRLGVIGVAAGVAYEGIKRMVEALDKLGERSATLTTLSARSGIAAVEFQRLESTLTRMGVSPGSARTGVTSFGDFFQRLKQHQVSALDQIEGGSAPINTQTYYRGIEGMSAKDAFDTVVKRVLGSKNSPAMQARILNAGGLPGDELAGKSPEEYEKEAKEALAAIDAKTVEAAKKMQDAGDKVKELEDKLWNKFLGMNAEHTTKARDDLSRLLEMIDKLGEGAEGASKKIERLYVGPNNSPQDRLDDAFKQFKNDKESENTIKRGTQLGVADGLRDFFSQTMGGSGYQNAAYHPGGGGGGGGGGGFRSGGGYQVLPNGDDGGKMPGAAPVGSNEAKGVGGGSTAGGPFDRTRFNEELARKPWLRNKLMRIAANEQSSNPAGTQAIFEETMNRAAMRGTSLEKEARWTSEGGYYQNGTMGRGALENARSRAILENGLKNALGGANTIDFATDNASGGFAERQRRSGKFIFHKKINGETFFHPGSAEPAHQRRWEAMIKQQRDIDYARRTGGSDEAARFSQYGDHWGTPFGDKTSDQNSSGRDWSWMRKYQNIIDRRGVRGGLRKSMTAPRTNADFLDEFLGTPEDDGSNPMSRALGSDDLLKMGKQSGLHGGATKISGDASVNISLDGFPRGTRTQVASSGIFKEVSLNRGRSMGLASQDA